MNNNKKIATRVSIDKKNGTLPRVFARLLSIEETKKIAGATRTCVGSTRANGTAAVDCTYDSYEF